MSNYLDDSTIYVFVRNDLPIEQQFVQAIHAAWHSGHSYGQQSPYMPHGVPYVVLVGVKNFGSLEKARAILNQNGLQHYVFNGTDIDPSGRATAIASHPLTKDQKQFLAKYRLWRVIPAPVSAGVFNDEAGANAVVAQSAASPNGM